MGKKPTRYFSSLQEAHVASLLGGKTTPNSGATPFFKGDVVAGDFLIECKAVTSERDSFSVKRGWIEALESERVGMRKPHCALAFQFAPQKSGSPANRNYFVVDEGTFAMLLGLYAKDGGSR